MSRSCPSRRQALQRSAGVIAFPLLTMSETIQAAPLLPQELKTVLPDASLIGSGALRFFGLRVYEARLWATSGFAPENYAVQPLALELIYDRKLDGVSIAERSIAEMRRVGSFSEVQAQRWLELMKQAFPSVVAKDRLLGFSNGLGEVSFFHNGRLTAQTHDAEYVRLFFGIWLASQTSAPALRNSLLGIAG